MKEEKFFENGLHGIEITHKAAGHEYQMIYSSESKEKVVEARREYLNNLTTATPEPVS